MATINLTGSPSLPSLGGSGGIAVVNKLNGSPALPALTSSGVLTIDASSKDIVGTISLPPLTANGVLKISKFITGSVPLPLFTVNGLIRIQPTINGIVTLPGIGVNGVGVVRHRITSEQSSILLFPASGFNRQPEDVGVFAKRESEEVYSLRLATLSNNVYGLGIFANRSSAQLYSMKATVTSIQNYTSRILAVNRQSSFGSISASLEASYSIQHPIAHFALKPYNLSIGDPVNSTNSMPYSSRVGAITVQEYSPLIKTSAYVIEGYSGLAKTVVSNSQAYSPLEVIRTFSEQNFAGTLKVGATVHEVYQDAIRVFDTGAQAWSIQFPVQGGNDHVYANTITVVSFGDHNYDLRVYNQSSKNQKQIYDILGITVINLSNVPRIILGGRDIPIGDASLSLDETGYAWVMSATLLDMGDYALLTQDTPFDVDFAGDTYKFIVDSKRLVRNRPGQVLMTLQGVSPTASLESPRATLVTKTWSTLITSKAAAEEVAGAAIDWQLVDWAILPGRLAVINASPIAIIQQIASSAGGVVETKPDGTLIVRPKYKISTELFDTLTPDHVLSDVTDNLSIQESLNATKTFNKFRIKDLDPLATSDVVEFTIDDNDAALGVLSVYPSPYRTNLTIGHSGTQTVSITAVGEVARQVTETISFTVGTASLQYPVLTIDTVVWASKSLGAIASTVNSSNISAPTIIDCGYSVATITYTTRSLNFNISAPEATKVQFIVLET